MIAPPEEHIEEAATEWSTLFPGKHLTALEWRELVGLAAGHRLLVIHRPFAGVSWSALFSVALALLVELALAAGAFWLVRWQMVHHRGGTTTANSALNNSALAIGGIQVHSMPRPHPSGPAIDRWRSPPWPQPPPLPNSSFTAPQATEQALLNYPNPTAGRQIIIGVASNVNAWQAPTPALALPRARSMPQRTRRLATGPLSRWGANPNAGFGEPYSLVKGDQTLAPAGQGGGLGRGLSAANEPNPRPIDPPARPLWSFIPLKNQLSPPHVSPVLKVQVRPDGKAAAVTVLRSSGQKAFDQACVDWVRLYRFLPALKNGRPVVGYFIMKIDLHRE